MIDKSATGSTLFIEPSSVARYYEEEIRQNSCTRKSMIFPSCLRLHLNKADRGKQVFVAN